MNREAGKGAEQSWMHERVSFWKNEIASHVGSDPSIPGKLKQLAEINAFLPVAEALGHHVEVVEIYNNLSLVGKHIRMGAGTLKDKYADELITVAQSFGFKMMERGVRGAEKYLEKHPEFEGREFLANRLGRFQGDLELQRGNTEEALRYFKGSITKFEGMEGWQNTRNALEIRIFMSEAEVAAGELHEGIREGGEAHDEFNTPKWQEFKEKDYSTWVIWRSGAIVKLMRAIGRTSAYNDITGDERDKLTSMFLESDKTVNEALRSAKTDEERGQYIPRRDELAAAREELVKRRWLE